MLAPTTHKLHTTNTTHTHTRKGPAQKAHDKNGKRRRHDWLTGEGKYGMCKLIFIFHFLAPNDYNDGGVTHHHHAPNGEASPQESRYANNFHPTYPANQSVVNPALPPHGGDGMQHMAHAPAHAVAPSSSKIDDDVDNNALFGDLPEAKRRKFILVDDAQRGTRVRVRVMLDQVRMHEMPDSYRKNNSVYPRSWFATEMQSPPSSPRKSRWADDMEKEEEGTPAARSLVPAPLLDGSDTKVPVPRMSRTKRSKEVTLNDLGYRMSWSQSRVFAGRTLFLQRSRKYTGAIQAMFIDTNDLIVDAYRNKMRSTMVAAGQDVTQVAPHFETRVGKRKWLERSKRAKREASP